jgi:hypothetical protein
MEPSATKMKRVKGSGHRCGGPEDEPSALFRFQLQSYGLEEHAGTLVLLEAMAGTSEDQSAKYLSRRMQLNV